MTRYELSDGKSHKFWAAGASGSELTTNWGRIGTAGQTKTKSFDSAEAAEKELAKVTRSKVKKGYVLVGGAPSASAQAVKKVPAKKTPAPKAKKEKSVPVEDKTKSAAEEPAGLPDESVVSLEALSGFLPADPDNPPDLPVPTPAQAWKRFVARGSQRFKMRAVNRDNRFEGLGTIINQAIDGEVPEIPTDITEAARFMAFAERGVDWNWKREYLVDIAMAAGGLSYAASSFIGSLEWVLAHGRLTHGDGASLTDQRVRRLWRLRAFACAASPEDYEAALGVLHALSPLALLQAVAATAAFPRDAKLRSDAIAAYRKAGPASKDPTGQVQTAAKILLWDAQTIEEAESLCEDLRLNVVPLDLAPVVARFGAAASKLVMQAAEGFEEREWTDKSDEEAIASLLSATSAETPLSWLIKQLPNDRYRNALAAAATSYPVRTLGLLGPVAAGRGKAAGDAAGLVAIILREHPSALEPASSTWTEAQLKKIAEIAKAQVVVPPASFDECPAVLREPRWEKARPKAKKAKPLDLKLLDYDVHMKWPAGLREKWLEQRGEYGWVDYDTDVKWEELFKRRGIQAAFLSAAPEHIARPFLPKWKPGASYYTDAWAERVAARFELDAHAGITYYLEADRVAGVGAALPYADPAFVLHIADAYVRLKSARKAARAWFDHHPEAAFVGLLPLALGSVKPRAQLAQRVIAYMVGQGHGGLLVEVAARYGDEAKSRAEVLVQLDPLDDLPKKIPALPDWTTGVVSPELKRGGSLPGEALQTFITMLAISKPSEPYAGVEVACALLEPKSLARFSWSLFEAWRLGGMDSKQSWAFLQMGLLGDDECARKLTPILKKWPGEGGHARATLGLDILAGIGTDVALMNLYGMSQKLKFKGLKNKAGEKVQEIAQERGLTELELADRLVPDFDLDAKGSMTLDFGPRTFTVTFDESLKPVIRDEDGKVRKSLPKPNTKDDAEKSGEATARFKLLKKDAKSVGQMQIARLEEVMCQGRTWTQEDFQGFLVEHPLLINVVRRLVWGVYVDGSVVATFRVTEDASLSDSKDEVTSLPEGRIGIVHHLDIVDKVAGEWGELFADYELLQPFDQLGRSTFALSAEELKNKSIDRVEGLKVPTGKVLGLEKLGWRRGDPEDGGVIGLMQRPVEGGGYFVLSLNPGMVVGDLGTWPEQELGKITRQRSACGYGNGLELESVSPTLVSEVIRSVETLRI